MKSVVAFSFGLLAGALIVLFCLSAIKLDKLWSGIANGFGAGIGVIVGLTLLNQLVGFLDRLSSGKA